MLESTVKIYKDFTLSFSQKCILRYLLYFDLFDHPVTKEELQKTLKKKEFLAQEIEPLLNHSIVFKLGEFYSLREDTSLVEKRKKGQQLAIAAMAKAIGRAKFIFNFPFVKGVYISGSVSKGVLEENGDVDYFIVTKPGRLWLSRSLLILYKKLFLFNSRKFFCLNYFIDSNHLEIEEKNVFTATELLTLIPMFQDEMHKSFTESNQWISKFYPNQQMKQLETELEKGKLKSTLEWWFSSKLGQLLDVFLMELTMKVWKRKFEDFEPPDFNLALKSRTYVSKHHPHNYQKKVLDLFENRKFKLERKFKIDLSL